MRATLHVSHPGFASEIASLLREARALAGWSQRELAARASTSQSMVSRIEREDADEPDLLVAERLLAAFGFHVTLDVNGRHLEDRRRQSDLVHAVVAGFIARHFCRDGWLTTSEAQIGDTVPRGWIDLLAFRESDASLVVEETKTEILDTGGLLRQVGFYEREAFKVARTLGWRAERVTVLVVVVDSEAVAQRIQANRDLLSSAFPTPPRAFSAWVRDPSRPMPGGWTLASADPRDRGASWLRGTPLGERQRPPAFLDYADAAQLLTARAVLERSRRRDRRG
jgi:transcriptional regulator with XRE-family HTH domain